MLTSSTIWVTLLAVAPVLLYSYLIYSFIPKDFISLKRARRYLVAGLLSPTLILLFYFLFPNWSDFQSSNIILSYIIFAIVQIGFLEESAKYCTFFWVSKERRSSKYDLPIALMFYSMMASVGFAITENISYLMDLKNQLNDFSMISEDVVNKAMTQLAITRSIISAPAHMMCGIICGYFLSKAHIINIKLIDAQERHNYIFKKWKNIFLGILSASIFHGIFDLNLLLPNNSEKKLFMIIIMLFGFIISRFIVINLIKKSKIQLINRTNSNLLIEYNDEKTC